MSKRLRKAAILGCCLVGLLVVAPSGASAAGKPIWKAIQINPKSTAASLTSLEVEATLNPNGSNTTVTWEYKKQGSSTWITVNTYVVGGESGDVELVETFTSLTPNTNYEVRVNGTNGSGTLRAGPRVGRSYWWSTSTGEIKGAGYASEGLANFEWSNPSVHTNYNVECHQAGWGTLGNIEGKGDSHHLEMSACSLFENGKKAVGCTIKPFSAALTGDTLSLVGGQISMPISGCFGEVEAYVFTGSPFYVHSSGLTAAKTQPLSMGSSGYILGHPATASINSTMFLTGAFTGQSFALIDSLVQP